MTQHNKQRHAAAMLVHQLGSGIEALSDLPPDIASENIGDLTEMFLTFGQFISRMVDIEIAKNEQLRSHQ